VEPRRITARRAGLAALAALLVLGASACSGGSLVGKAPAATVGDGEISQAEVVSATEASKRFYEYNIDQGQDADGSLAGVVDQLSGQSSYTVGTAGAAKILSEMIVTEVKRQELDRVGKLPTKAERQKIREDLNSQVGGAAALKKFDAAYVARYLDQRAIDEAFQRWAAAEADKDVKPLTKAEREAKMRELYQEVAPSRPLCLNAIQSSTEDEAKAARARVDGGEDFLAVSKSLVPAGTDFPEEGLVACLGFEDAKAAFGQDFSKVQVGDIVGPVPFTSQQGSPPVYLVFRVDGLDGQTYEEMLPQMEEAVPVQAPATDPTTFDTSALLAKLLKAADIEVNPVFGRWSDARQAVVPPRVPSDGTDRYAFEATTSTVPTAGS
jgi:hypothetical protein